MDLTMLAKGSGTDGNDTIEYTEFIAAAMDKRKILKEDVVWEAFKIFDQDGSGTVTKKELLQILTGRTSDKIRQVHGDKAIDNFLDAYDTTGDDVIDFDEFMGMLSSATVSYKAQGTASQPPPKRQSSRGAGSSRLEAFVWCSSCSSTSRSTPEQVPLPKKARRPTKTM